jgi:hypothetical protein
VAAVKLVEALRALCKDLEMPLPLKLTASTVCEGT